MSTRNGRLQLTLTKHEAGSIPNSGSQMLEKISPAGRWRRPGLRTLLGVVVVMVVAILVLNPELAFLGFLLDPVMLDVAILLFGTQILLLNGQIRTFLVTTYLGIARRLSVFRLRRQGSLLAGNQHSGDRRYPTSRRRAVATAQRGVFQTGTANASTKKSTSRRVLIGRCLREGYTAWMPSVIAR
jgi:hypothetical protein